MALLHHLKDHVVKTHNMDRVVVDQLYIPSSLAFAFSSPASKSALCTIAPFYHQIRFVATPEGLLDFEPDKPPRKLMRGEDLVDEGQTMDNDEVEYPPVWYGAPIVPRSGKGNQALRI